MKRTAVFLLFFTLSSSLWAFEGAWGLYTEIVQVIYRGRVLGFAEPEEANKVSLVHFIDGEKADLVYAGEKYEATYLQEGNALIFESSEFSPPLVITMLEAKEGAAYRFSYTLVDAKETLTPGQGSENFVNYLGTMVFVGTEKKDN